MAEEKPEAMQMESKLLKYLMLNYDREVRPVIDPKTAMKVFVGITLTQIFDMVMFCRVTVRFPNNVRGL